MGVYSKRNQTVSEENALVLFQIDRQKCRVFWGLL